MSISTWQQLGALVKDGENLTDDQLAAFTRVAGRWIAPWCNGTNWNTQNYKVLQERAAWHKLRCGIWTSVEYLMSDARSWGREGLLVVDHTGPSATAEFPDLIDGCRLGLPAWDIAVRVPTLYQVDWDAVGLRIPALPVWRASDYLKGDGLLTPNAQMKALRSVLSSDGSESPIPKITLPLVHGVLGTAGDDLRIELLDVLEAKLHGYGIGVVIEGLENLSGGPEANESFDRLRTGDWALLASQAGRLWQA